MILAGDHLIVSVQRRVRIMNIQWPGSRCILCLEEMSLSREHIIPDALGGILTCQFLCKDCNSYLGSSVEAEAKTDPSIRVAIANLQSHIPELAGKFMENQNFISHGPGGTERGSVRAGEFRVKSRTREDGTLIQPTDTARESVEKILRKADANDDVIKQSLLTFDKVEENERVKLPFGLEVIKWPIEKLEIDLSHSRLMDPIIPLKIAYEFLALHLGTAIYNESPKLQELRTALRQSVRDHPSFQVDRLNASDYKPFHGICFEGNDPYCKVLIRLFGWLAFRVHFRRLAIGGPRFIYTHHLDTHEESFNELPE